MEKWRAYLVGTGLVALAILSALGSANDAYAIDYVLSDAASCTGLPGGGETWIGATSTCSKTTNLNIAVGDTLTIANGVTLEFPTNRDLINRGGITNNGIINFLSGGDVINRNTATFVNSGVIDLDSTAGGTARLVNRDTATFTNAGIISINGPSNNDAQLRNLSSASFTNTGTITIEGTSNNSGQLRNLNSASFTNMGTITIDGTDNNTGQLRNFNSAGFTNSGTITVTGVNNNSGRVDNRSNLTNLGSLTTNNEFRNNNANSEITNSGTIQITLNLNNNNGLINNNCGTITFGSITGNPIIESACTSSGSSTAYEDPTIGKSNNGKQLVEDGICIDFTCWTVTADYHQDFELVEMLSDSTHTISTTVYCHKGVLKCNYVAFGVSPYGTTINDSVWKVILEKDHLDNWTMKVIDNDEYLGEVTSTTQIVDGKYLSASATIEFKKPTPGMILNIEVRDSGGGYRDFKFNDGISIVDAYAYPLIESSYDPPLEIKPLCLNENPNKRYTCAFDKVRDWATKNAQIAYDEIMKK